MAISVYENGNPIAGQKPIFNEYLAHALNSYQKTFGDPLNRPWTYDADVINFGNSIINSYLGALNAYNSQTGQNVQPEITSINQLPNTNYQLSLPAENKGTGGFFGGIIDLGIDILNSPIGQIGLAIITSGASLPEQLAMGAAVTIARGGSVEDVLKNAVGTLVGAEVRDFVTGLEGITDPTVKTALANSLSMAGKAAATGGDIGQALIAGAAGGAIAAETQSATDSNAIARAAGEYAKALAAGQTQQQALTGALSGFISQQDKATAAPLIQAEAAKITSEPPSGADVVTTPFEPSGPPISSQQVTALPEQPVISSSDTSQLPSGARFATPEDIAAAKNKFGGGSDTTTPTLLPEVPVTSERDSQIMDLTGITSDAPSSKAASAAGLKSTIMLSGLGAGTPAAGAPAAAPAPTGGQSPPGSQALAQALRTGDVGDPLFGRKGKSNRPVWNIESLRTKDETGA